MKVIHVLHHSSSQFRREWKFDLFVDGWHVRAAQEMLKRSNQYKHECWHPENKLKKAMSGEKNGITYRAFPSIRLRFYREYSWSLIKELRRQCATEPVIVHLHGIHNDLAYLACLSLPRIPIVGSHLASAPYVSGLPNFIAHLPLSLIEPRMLKRMDRVLVGSREIHRRLSKYCPGSTLSMPVGVDFTKFGITDKAEARRQLGLPMDKKIMLHVGKFGVGKGIEKIIDMYQKLSNTYNVQLIVIGGQSNEPLYGKLVQSGATVLERIPQDALLPYYNASDVYLLLADGVSSLDQFGGIGIAPVEALACGTPLVSTTLKHFLGDESERNKIGRMPIGGDDAMRCVTEVFENATAFRDCRDMALKYYGWPAIADNILAIYDELGEKYYG